MGSVDGHILGINGDMGEGFGLYRIGDDRALMPSEIQTYSPAAVPCIHSDATNATPLAAAISNRLTRSAGATERIPLNPARPPRTSQAER